MKVLQATGGVPNFRFIFDKKQRHEVLANGDASHSGNRGGARRQFDTPGHEFISALLMKGPMSPREIAARFAEVGRAKSSVHSQIDYLKNAGAAKHDASGEKWMLTKKGRDRIRHKTAAKKKRL